MLFSVLIANYNNGEFLQECIDSIISQTYTHWEIIIVDDCSTDDLSIKVYDKYKTHDKFHIYHNETNQGCGYTKKRCVELANGELCGFVDPDDKLMDKALATMVAKHNEWKDAALIHSNCLCVNKSLEKPNLYYPTDKPSGKKTSSQLDTFEVSHFTTFKKAFYDKSKKLSAEYKRAVDQDLFLKLEEVGPLYYINDILYFYRIHNNGISTKKNMERALYWRYRVAYDACSRRNMDHEEYFSYALSEITGKAQAIKNSLTYRVGYYITTPLRHYRRFKNKKKINKYLSSVNQ